MLNDERPFDTTNLSKLAYSVEETMELLSIRKTTLYRLVKEGHLRLTKLGRKSIFLSTDISDFVKELQRGSLNHAR